MLPRNIVVICLCRNNFEVNNIMYFVVLEHFVVDLGQLNYELLTGNESIMVKH